MTKFWKISNVIVLGLLILICGLGTFYKHISFGLGLGDIFGYFILYIGTITHLILTIIFRNKGAVLHLIFTVTFLTFAILIGLNATIWRGHEYSWNGSIFYLPCPTEIKIQNEEFEEKLLIQMCTMDYYSEFIGTWDGNFMTIKKGEIKVPKELQQYISRPIDKVEIEPDSYETFVDNTIIKLFNFNSDTLKTNEEYKIEGEINAIRNSTPVMKVKIK